MPHPVKKHPGRVLACLLLLTLLPACATTGPAVLPPGERVSPAPASPRAAAVIKTARSLIGVPYKWGGSSPGTGFDCSGLVWYVFRANGVNLPRTTADLVHTGSLVDRKDLLPGDLVFHRVDKKGKSLHVGIVTERATFVHSPSSGKQVMETDLNAVWWADHYLTARRIF